MPSSNRWRCFSAEIVKVPHMRPWGGGRAALGLGYAAIRTHDLQKADQARIKEISHRLAEVQRRYTQERASKSTVEDEKQAVQSELEKLRQEEEQLRAEGKQLKERADAVTSAAASLEKRRAASEARAASLESKNSHLTEHLTRIEAERAALEQKERLTFRTLQERETELKQLGRKHDRCAEQNARLWSIGDELIKRYQRKGVMTTILEKEPFTQIKRVELEGLAKDYREQIDRQKLPSK